MQSNNCECLAQLLFSENQLLIATLLAPPLFREAYES